MNKKPRRSPGQWAAQPWRTWTAPADSQCPGGIASDANLEEAWWLPSARYAASASGTLRVIAGPGGYADTTWNLLELPTRKTNPAVTQLMQIDPKSGISTTIFSR